MWLTVLLRRLRIRELRIAAVDEQLAFESRHSEPYDAAQRRIAVEQRVTRMIHGHQ
jgi:hypothetical protein